MLPMQSQPTREMVIASCLSWRSITETLDHVAFIPSANPN